jgi:hypothetical protein
MTPREAPRESRSVGQHEPFILGYLCSFGETEVLVMPALARELLRRDPEPALAARTPASRKAAQ